jgi:hypothetical protein
MMIVTYYFGSTGNVVKVSFFRTIKEVKKLNYLIFLMVKIFVNFTLNALIFKQIQDLNLVFFELLLITSTKKC